MYENPAGPLTTSERLAKLRCQNSITQGPIRYEQRLIDCSNRRCKSCETLPSGRRKASHGPYWYLITTDPRTERKVTLYIGSELDTNRYRLASKEMDWQTVDAEKRERREKRRASHAKKEQEKNERNTSNLQPFTAIDETA